MKAVLILVSALLFSSLLLQSGWQQPVEAETPVSSQQSLNIEIPNTVMGQIHHDKMIPAAYLDLLARLAQQPPLPVLAESRLVYNEWGDPEARIETYGNKQYGLEMQASPIASGIGIHGEVGDWSFYGLPAGLNLRGQHYLDLRGSDHNQLTLTFQGQTPEQEALIHKWFAREIITLISYDRFH